jgi:GAF domain-containing protein
MSKIKTFKEVAELVEKNPDRLEFVELFMSALEVADERSELEFQVCELNEKLESVVAQAKRVAVAETAQQLTEKKIAEVKEQ